jgi:hypothetical protein
VVLVVLLGAAAGFAASGLHPGPRGKQGQTGPAGATGQTGQTGQTGPQGPAGSAAQTTDLGVCVDIIYSNGFVQSASVTPPSRHPDGTTYCSIGSYVPIAPQPITPASTGGM